MPVNNEKPSVPPTRKPISDYPTPDHKVAFYTELVNRDDTAYIANAPVKRGSRYSTMVGAKRDVIATYPNLFFLRERRFQLNDQLVLWDWATDEQAHDTYNADINYVANAVPYPAFTRVYTIRRDLYELQPTLNIGSPLPGIISVEITSPGQNHTKARGVINGTGVAIDFVVDPNGSLISAVITDTGEELIRDKTPITIIGDGQDSAAIARSQPVGCVLTAQKKEELPQDDPLQHALVRVTRVYETLPGPWIYSTRIDKDGAIVKTQTRRQVQDFIVDQDIILNGEWSQTWHKGTDAFVAEETIEARPLPGNPIVSTRVDDDGMVVTVTKTLVDASLVVSGETLIAGIWTRTRKEELASTTFVKDTSATYKVCWQVSEARPIPGNPIPDTELDKDGVAIDIARTMKDATTIVTSETFVGSVWVRTEADPITDLVSWEVVRAREIPGNVVPSAKIDQDHETATISTTLSVASGIVPDATESGGIITTTEQGEVTDLVSEKIVTQKEFLDAAFYSVSIPNLIPESFRATIPTHIESHVVAGIASEPTLVVGQLEVSERQLTKLLKEVRVTSFGSITYPQIQIDFELTELYGGGELGIVKTLNDTPMVPDEGYLVTASSVRTIWWDGINGLFLKETAQLNGTEWPTITGVEYDQDMQIEYPFETQVVVPTYTVTTGAYILETLDPIDTWRSRRKKVTKVPTATGESDAIITERYHPFRFPGLLTITSIGAYYVRASNSELCKHTVRTWWTNSASLPVIAVDEIIMDDPIISTLNDITVLAYSGPCLHDDLTTFGVLFWPATTPTYTEYVTTWQGNEKIVAATVSKTDIPNLWKIETISVTMR